MIDRSEKIAFRMQLWWRHMADIMQTNASGRPVTEPLPLLFHLD
ncbi:hypothetical protein [Lichenicoccus sp.]